MGGFALQSGQLVDAFAFERFVFRARGFLDRDQIPAAREI